MGTLAMALLALGMLSRLEDLADVADDDIGLLIDIDSLPQRVRLRARGAAPQRADGAKVAASREGALL